MLKAIALALLLVATTCVEIDHFQQQMDRVKETTWGQIVYSMVEVASEANGALQELTQAIDELVEEVNGHLAEAEHRYQTFTNEFHRDTNRLEEQANDAQIELSQAQDLIDNVILPGIQQTKSSQERLSGLIEDNRHALKSESVQRNQQGQAAQERINSHQMALDAVDESIAALRGLANGPSLVQVQRIQRQVESIEAAIGKHETFGPLMINIMEMTSQQNFSDQGALKNLLQLFSDLRNTVVEELNHEVQAESEAQTLWAQRESQLNTEYLEFQRQLNEKVYLLAAFNTQLEQNKATVSTLQSDLASATAQLQELKDWFATETQVYEDLKSQYEKESSAAQEARQLLTNPDFLNQVRASLN